MMVMKTAMSIPTTINRRFIRALLFDRFWYYIVGAIQGLLRRTFYDALQVILIAGAKFCRLLIFLQTFVEPQKKRFTLQNRGNAFIKGSNVD